MTDEYWCVRIFGVFEGKVGYTSSGPTHQVVSGLEKRPLKRGLTTLGGQAGKEKLWYNPALCERQCYQTGKLQKTSPATAVLSSFSLPQKPVPFGVWRLTGDCLFPHGVFFKGLIQSLWKSFGQLQWSIAPAHNAFYGTFTKSFIWCASSIPLWGWASQGNCSQLICFDSQCFLCWKWKKLSANPGSAG